MRAIEWANGMLMVFDNKGKQMPDYQGAASEMIPKLKKDFPDIVIDHGDWYRDLIKNADEI